MRRLSSEEPIHHTPASDARGTAVRAPLEAPSGTGPSCRRSPSAWDEPAETPEGEEGPEPEPGALQEWYRYVDSLARPSRRLQEDEEDEPLSIDGESQESAAARPWAEPWTPPVQDGVVDPEAAQEIVEQLSPTVSRPAPVAFSPSLPDVAVPDLTEFIPTLEVARPEIGSAQDLIARLIPPAPQPVTRPVPSTVLPAAPPTAVAPTPPQTAEPAAPPPSVESAAPPPNVTALVPVPGSDRQEATYAAPRSKREKNLPARDLPGIPEIREQWPRYAERLREVPASEVAQNSYKTPFKETREALIERLLDPPLTLEETARLIGVCPTTVRRYTNRGWLAHYRTVGNQRRFRLSAVLTFLDEHGETSLVDEE